MLFIKNKPLLFSLLLAIAITAADGPLWIEIFCFVTVSYKILCELLDLPVIGRKWTTLLSVGLMAEVALQFGAVFSQEASTTLILGLTSLKIVDYRSPRDQKFLFLLGFLLTALKTLYTIDIYWLIPLFFTFFGLWWSILSSDLKHQLRFLSGLFIGSIPLTLLLFIIFPRFVVPWAQAKNARVGTVGFSENLDPGSIAELAKNETVAFRVHFSDNLEFKNKVLYWRGAVLTKTSGLHWWSPKIVPYLETEESGSKGLRYEVQLEPDNLSVLFTLDKTLSINSEMLEARRYQNFVYRSLKPVDKPTSYEGYASIFARDTQIPEPELYAAPPLQERTKRWVDRIKKTVKTDEEKMTALKGFFTDGSFSYTIKPGTFKADDLDEFLFKRRRGFCEHFAGSYATLARSLGLASRVIVGYQGGVFNQYGDFWKVSGQDAHAWVEVFEGGFWQRIDPTEWVAPLRIDMGAESFFNLSEEEQNRYSRNGSGRYSKPFWLSWYDESTNLIEELNYKWTQFLLDFGKSSQQSVWDKLKENVGWSLLLVAMIIIFISLSIRLVRPKLRSPKGLSLIYSEMFKWGEKQNLPRYPDDTPLYYSKKLGQNFPHLQPYLERLSAEYDKNNYQMLNMGQESGRELLREWKKLSRDQNRA